MLHRAWIAREAPLARCPLSACRRSQTCRHDTDADPCRRLHQTQDAMRYELARKLQRWTAAVKRRDPEGKNFAAEGSPEFERRIKILYDGLRAADRAHSAAEMAARKPAKAKKPATTPSGG